VKITYPVSTPMPTQVELKEKRVMYEQILQNKVAEVLDKQNETNEYKYWKSLGSNVDVYA
jgi:hypothetical protein